MLTQAQITNPQMPAVILMDFAGENPNTRSRVKLYIRWLEATGRNVLQPDLPAWVDDLEVSPRSMVAYVSTVRNVLLALKDSEEYRNTIARAALAAGLESPADLKAVVDEHSLRFEFGTRKKVQVPEEQDRPDEKHVRLTQAQAEALLAAPDVTSLKGLRDAAIAALLLCTGIREGELSGLEVEDLRKHLNGELALNVRNGKGNKARMIPYGELNWCLVIVDKWLERAGIEEGPVFRGFERRGEKLRSDALSTRAVRNILAAYPISINGEKAIVRPHDCRRTYARRLHDASLKIAAIQQNLGHSDIKTTLGYIGELDASQRRAKAIYSYDLSQLEAE